MIYRHRRTLIMVAYRGRNGGYFICISAHIIEQSKRDNSPALRVLDTVYEVADIVKISCDLRKLDIVLGISERLKDVFCGLRGLSDVRKAMFGVAEGDE